MLTCLNLCGAGRRVSPEERQSCEGGAGCAGESQLHQASHTAKFPHTHIIITTVYTDM